MTTTHRETHTELYHRWGNMKSRCYYIKNKHYKNYGGRGIEAKIRGEIGIIESGNHQVSGTVELFHCVSLDKMDFEIWKDRHKLNIKFHELLKIYPKPYAWCFTNIKKFDNPIPYEHRRGCAVWVNY